MASSSSTACPVCCSSYTNVKRIRLICAHCNYEACQDCYRTYITSIVQDPHCMSCRRAWTRDVLLESFPPSWLNGEFKKHRETVLVDREKQLLPASQNLVPSYREVRSLRQGLPGKMQRLEVVKAEFRQLTWEVSNDRYRADSMAARLMRGDVPTEVKRAKKDTFACPCPTEECRGFMDSAMVCGVCDAKACVDCGVVLDETDHRCDPNVKENFKVIKAQTRPCPQCAVPTFKISGCNQMWCTSCQTTWDWVTGNVVQGVIHNPHYFQFLRERSANGEIPRQPGDEQECNRMTWPTAQAINRRIFAERTENRTEDREAQRNFQNEINAVYSMLRDFSHITEVDIPALRNRYRHTDNIDLRLKFLVNEISEEDMRVTLQRREKKREKDIAIREIYEMLGAAGKDIFWGHIDGGITMAQLLIQLKELAGYANTHLGRIGTQYKMKVPLIRIPN